MAENFDPRSHNGRDFAPANLLGRCKRCRKAYRKTAQPGRADFALGDRGWAKGKRIAAFRFEDGMVVQALALQHSEGTAIRCECDQAWVTLKPVQGKYSPVKVCDGRCMAATGNVCECQCGGKNHGGRHAC